MISGGALPVFDLELDVDLFEFVVSARSRFGVVASDCENEFLGLSDLEPGILDLNPRKERDDSLVSDLLIDGYDCRPSA